MKPRVYVSQQNCIRCDGALVYPMWTWYAPDWLIVLVMRYIGVTLHCSRCYDHWVLKEMR